MMRSSWMILIGLLIPALGFSQSNRELLEYGDAAFKNGQYASAVYFYSKIIGKNSAGNEDVTYPYELKSFSSSPKRNKSDSTSTVDKRYAYVIHKLAAAHRLNKDYDNAELWYVKAAGLGSDQFPNAKYWLGVSLMKNEKYDSALTVLEEFKGKLTDPEADYYKRAEGKMVSCGYARNPENTKDYLNLTELDSMFNEGSSSFATSYYSDQSIVFTTAREANYIGEDKNASGYYRADLWVTTDQGDGWEAPQRMEEPITSPDHEGSGVLSIDRQTFYFTRWSATNPSDCGIFVSKKFNRQWMLPIKLDQNVNMEGFKSMNPSLNIDETKLYFSSNRPGGEGGMDIWYCNIDEEGNISNPYNLGPTVNTPEDEISPFHHFQSNTLFFSSEGHVGFGGLDVYKTQYNEDNDSWSTPLNVGAPVNSSRDDAYFIIDRYQMKGFVSSDRKRCNECAREEEQGINGYCYRIYTVEQEEMEFSISGFVYDMETEEIIPNSLITFKDIRGEFDQFFLMTDDKGYYERDLKANMDIFMKAQKVKYFGDAATVGTTGLTVSTNLEQDFFLNPLPEGEIEIPGIEYDFDKATLRPASKKILDDLVKLLEVNDNWVIEIASHTDVRGDDSYNMWLSNERAKSVVNYLIEHGIKSDRLKPQGYGETKLLISDATTEEQHQRNRRTTFTPLKQDYKKIGG
jgi:OOP family OmpA-OmpF porin